MVNSRLWVSIFMVFLFIGCSRPENNQEGAIQYPGPGNNLSPQQLAQAYCGSCHVYPEPKLLPKAVWNNTLLKNMGSRLGVVTEGYDPFRRHPYHKISMYDNYVLKQLNVYPEDTLISRKDWDKLVNYYLSNAPDSSLPQEPKEEIAKNLEGFSFRSVDNLPSQQLSTLVTIDSVNQQIYWGSRMGDLMVLDARLELEMQLSLPGGAPSQMIAGNLNYVLTMGNMDPTDEPKGALHQFKDRQRMDILADLQRPVHLSLADLDKDGKDDFVISQFGNQTGKLSWFRANKEDKFEEHIVKHVAGAVNTEVGDFNRDGRLDIMALFGQGEERISIFYQTGTGDFQEEVLLRFPPVYGSSNFQLVDFNGDQEPDILYTNGDNADYSYSLKPYHGTRIFLNKGNFQYQQAFFYPLYGATKSIAKDFDQDGDLDMFTICFFPDFEAEFPEGFVYFENQGDLKFKPLTFPESKFGRWLVTDAGDIDGDGDYDIVLGSFLHLINMAPSELIEQWREKGYHMVVLENRLFD